MSDNATNVPAPAADNGEGRTDDRFAIVQGDCIEVLRTFEDNSVDAVVTDPPYELGFMGKSWDAAGIAYSTDLWRAMLRVLKPGGQLLAFGGTRTYHRMTCAIEDAGFEIRDSLHWFYGSGFPKSLNLPGGIGTALKPAHEPIVLARKPLTGTVAQNIAQHGTGGLNIDGCRLATTESLNGGAYSGGERPNSAMGCTGEVGGTSSMLEAGGGRLAPEDFKQPEGRWPANILFDEDAAAELDTQTGTLTSGKVTKDYRLDPKKASNFSLGEKMQSLHPGQVFGDSGGVSRFFYVAKPSRKERDQGCAHLPSKTAGEATDREDGSDGLNSPRAGAGRKGGVKNFHPTVKPVQLMRYLCRLITPPGGIVLDPFLGSGTTGMAALLEGFSFIGIEKTEEYLPIAEARIRSVLKEMP